MKMMRHCPPRTVGICIAIAAAFTISASAAETGLYFNAEGGISFAQDVDISSGGAARTAEFDTGFRAGVGVGYNFTRNLGVEFDTGWIWNEVSNPRDFGLNGDISLVQVPFMVNAVYRFETGSKWVPYVGVGVGASYSVFDVDATGVEDSDGDLVFAWQAMAGVRYMFQENMSIGAGYKYLGTGEADYEIDGASLEADSVHNHTFSVVFNMTF